MKFERLGDIITIKKGKKPLFSDVPSAESIRVLQIDDLRSDNNIKYTDEKTGVFANEDDILLAWDGANAGTIGYGKKGYIGSTIALLRKNIPEKYSTVFIGKFLQSQFDYLRSKSTGATIPHIDGKSLRDLTIPQIPLSDQIRIAGILSQAESLIAQRKQSISLLDELLKSTFLEMFGDPVSNEKGWEISNIGKQCDIKGGKRIPKESKLVAENTGFPYIKAGNIKKGKVTTTDLEYLTPEIREQLKRYTVEKGDVCITVVGANIGDIGIVPEELHLANLTENANKLFIKDKREINNFYLGYYLMTDFVQNNFKSNIRAAGVPKLAIFRIEQIELLMPPISLQTKFANMVEKVEALKSQYQQSLTELQNMYGVLSQKAFKGELGVDKKKLKEKV